jgi:hypothetical protein
LRRVERERRAISTAVGFTLSGKIYKRHFEVSMKSEQWIAVWVILSRSNSLHACWQAKAVALERFRGFNFSELTTGKRGQHARINPIALRVLAIIPVMAKNLIRLGFACVGTLTTNW